MSDLTPEQQYQKEYEEALAKMDAADSAQPEATPAPEPEPVKDAEPEPAKADEPKPVDPLEEIRAELERQKKIAADNKAWATKQSQELAALKREREQQQREAMKPQILEQNPDLADAIRYVTTDPAPQHQVQDKQAQWMEAVQTAHPGIFDVGIDPELEQALLAKRDSLGESWYDPLIAIREITAEKVAHAERLVGKRFAMESAKQAQKSAMSVPGTGSGAVRTPPNPDKEAVDRILKMSDAEFEKEVRRTRGF